MPWAIGIAVALVLVVGALLIHRASSRVNRVALADDPKPVSVVAAKPASYRSSHSYVGTIRPWVETKIGPQFESAYVDTVLVRPGAVVKKGDVLATLDCRNANATAQAVEMEARALDARQKAVADEASRLSGLLDGGFVSPNEAEQKTAQSSAVEAQLLAQKAKLLGSSLEVGDCILRAPFDGEIATRAMDPGGFVRPGVSILTLVDRRTVRVTADAPEIDFGDVAPGVAVAVHVVSTKQDLTAHVSRRAPAADPSTRTVHFELDVPDEGRTLPVDTTAELSIDVGEPVPATEIPLYAATIRGAKATLFVADGGVAHRRVVEIVGERAGSLFVEPSLAAGSQVVTEGRALLSDGDKVAVAEETAPTPTKPANEVSKADRKAHAP